MGENAINDLLVVVDVNAAIPYTKKGRALEKKEENLMIGDKRFSKYVHLLSHKFNSLIPNNEKDKLGYFNLPNKTTNLMVHQLSQMAIEKGNPDVLINVPHESFGVFDFYKTAELIQLGREQTKQALDDFEKEPKD